jgi:Glu-tRNA(Gln) amidotransferase subunit E-like FAD-binding protein
MAERLQTARLAAVAPADDVPLALSVPGRPDAIDEAIGANSEVVAKIRGGKVAAVGALVGAVMKTTGGKADAPRVRELILERLA